MKLDIKKLARDCASLHFEKIKSYKLFKGNNSLLKILTQSYEKQIPFAVKIGFFDTLYVKGRIYAFIIICPKLKGSFGVPSNDCSLQLRIKSPQARGWVVDTLKKNKKLINKKFDLLLDHSYKSIIDDLEELGLYVDLSITVGRPVNAKRALLSRYDNIPIDLSHLGLSVEPLVTNSECQKIINIFSSEIKSNPAYKWFKKNPDYLDEKLKYFKSNIKNANSFQYLIRNNKKIVGYFGLDVERNDLIFKSKANSELIFDKSIQGKGISKWAYIYLLKIMIKQKVNVFIGGTNQVAILRMNKHMKRIPFVYMMKYGKPITTFKTFGL